MTLDIVISMDDRFLYTNNWMHGDICQYDITDTRHPKLVGQIFLGGKLLKDGPLKLIDEVCIEVLFVFVFLFLSIIFLFGLLTFLKRYHDFLNERPYHLFT